MCPFGLEPFQRLDEFSSFNSCIKSFGRSIIPPLLTPSHRHELQQLRAAAANKEAEIFKRKEHSMKMHEKDSDVPSKSYNGSDFQTDAQESRALWYPSSKDFQEGVSVAISKFPTSGIYSSVHNSAIVCSDVVENSHRYATRTVRDSVFGSETVDVNCVECSHSNISPDCHECQAEYDQNFQSSNFDCEISPEVPCRTFSLLQPSVNLSDEQSTVEETECESLPTVICSQKYMAPDTDSESIVTSMTQSTDLEKYMEHSCEFSPDNSAIVWDSKSSSQLYTLSRSDDASSETIVNTENELTPCASTMAEFTDNIEDELSNADEVAHTSENKDFLSITLKRAHSVDSYMKIIQSCAKNMHVKKSQSEPFNTNFKIVSNMVDGAQASSGSKTSHLIKEDSKESEESKEIPDKDVCIEGSIDISPNFEENPILQTNENNSFKRKHIRHNSYTLDEPSSALILAHADCTCNFDAKCISPHCSALKDQDELISNSAFIKEKVEVDIPASLPQIKFPILNFENLPEHTSLGNGDLAPSVVVEFPVVKENSYEKSNSENTSMHDFTASITVLQTAPVSEASADLELAEREQLGEKLSNDLNECDDHIGQDYFKRIYQEIQESHEMRVKRLFDEQNKQWLKLQEEFKEQEKMLYEKLKLTITSPADSVSKVENPSKIEINDTDAVLKSDDRSTYNEDTVKNYNSNCEQVSILDNSLLHNHKLEVPCESSPSRRNSPSELYNHSETARAFITPSSECMTPNHSPSRMENIKDTQKNKDCYVDYESEEDRLYSCSCESFQNVNEFPSKSAVLLPHPNKRFLNSVSVSSDMNPDNSSACFCDKSPKQCRCCISFNECNGFDSNHTYLQYLPSSSEKNSIPDSKSEVELHPPQTLSSNSSVQKSNLNSVDINSTDISSYSLKVMGYEIPFKKANDLAFTKHSKSASLDTIEFPKDSKNVSQHLSKNEAKIPVDNIISSIRSLTLRKGSLSSLDISTNKPTIINPVLLKKFEKLPAFVKGYLTRRLFQTERVKSLIKTLQDTALLIGKLSEDMSVNRDTVSERDVDFHRQLIVQLMTTFHNVYDIFCTISTKERMNIIAESRSLRLKQKMETEQETAVPVISNVPAPVPSKKHKLSSATLKALERKRRSAVDTRTYTLQDFKGFRARSAIESRTYTIEDLKSHIGRPRSHMLSKSHSVSPSSIYKISVGLSPKRKTASSKATGSRRCLHLKWVP